VILRLTIPVALLLAAVVPNAAAQRFSTPFRVAVSSSDSAALADGGLLGPSDRDHRYTGFYVGLGAGTALGVYAITECSGGHECAVRPVPFAVLSMAVFSIAGALIGGLIPK
jgi:hypothetical protein